MPSSLQRYEEALLSYEEAIGLQPQDEDLAIEKAETLTKLKRDDEALSAFDQALQLAPQKSSIYQKKCELLITLKRYDEALSPSEECCASRCKERRPSGYNRGRFKRTGAV
jgi:tetratricopeptide (TPR) repeat protein